MLIVYRDKVATAVEIDFSAYSGLCIPFMDPFGEKMSPLKAKSYAQSAQRFSNRWRMSYLVQKYIPAKQ